MQKRILIILFVITSMFIYSGYAEAALQFLPRYQGGYGLRADAGGRDKPVLSCESFGGYAKQAGQSCSGMFYRGGLTCYKECLCDTSTYQYTITSHQGSGKLCASLSNACTDKSGTYYANCALNTCNVRNSTWIGESSKTTYTGNNYSCTSQNTSGSDGICYVCACPSDWASGSCPANAASCSTCKAVSPYTVNKFNLVSCKAGYYKDGNACTQCPAGYKCDGTGKTQCPAGSYAAAGSSTCSQCPKGQYSAAGASSCTNCAAGTYSDTEGTTSCSSCSAGTYSNAGASSCSSCSAGKYSTAGASYCNSCGAGTYSGSGASSCTQCKAGTYSSAGASSCSTCNAGTYSAAGASGCMSCPSGYVANAEGSACEADCGKYLQGNWISVTDETAYYSDCEARGGFGYGGAYYDRKTCGDNTYAQCLYCDDQIKGSSKDPCPVGYEAVDAAGNPVDSGMYFGCHLCKEVQSEDCSAYKKYPWLAADSRYSHDNLCGLTFAGYASYSGESKVCGGVTYIRCSCIEGYSWNSSYENCRSVCSTPFVYSSSYKSCICSSSDFTLLKCPVGGVCLHCTSNYGNGTYNKYYLQGCDLGYQRNGTTCKKITAPSSCNKVSYTCGGVTYCCGSPVANAVGQSDVCANYKRLCSVVQEISRL